jgi:hypothetical protein
MEIKTGKKVYTTTLEKTYSYLEIIPDVYAFKLEISETSTDPSISDKRSESQGITRKRGLSELKKGALPKPIVGRHHSSFVVSDKTLNDVKTFGYYGYALDDSKGFHNKGVYDWVAEGGSTDNILILEMNDHSFWTFDGRLLPVGIRFDENESAFHDKVYDLDKALRHLKKRNDVVFPRFYKYGTSYKMKLEKENDPQIVPLPYYRGDYGEKNHLTFFWRPDEKTANELHEKSGYDLFTYIYNNDLLGLKKAGATLTENMYDFYNNPSPSCGCSCSCSC